MSGDALDQPATTSSSYDQPTISSSSLDQPVINSSSRKRRLFASSLSAFTSSKRTYVLRKSKIDATRSNDSNQQSSNKHVSSDNEDDVELCSSYERLTPIQSHTTLSSTPMFSIHRWTPSYAAMCSSSSGNRTSDDGSHPSFCTGSTCSSKYSLEDRIRSTSPEFFKLDIDKWSWGYGFPQTVSSLPVRANVDKKNSTLEEERPVTPCSQLSISFSNFDMR